MEALHRNATSAGDIVNWIKRRGMRAEGAREPCDLNALVRDAVQTRRRSAPGSTAAVQLDTADALPQVVADRIGIEQVLTNLLRNAAEAMGGGTGHATIDVKTRLIGGTGVEPSAVQVTVRDAGPGLQGRSLDQLCAAFYTTKRDGMGLGLGICRAIVEQHGGRFTAEEHAAGGAAFSFELPTMEPISMERA